MICFQQILEIRRSLQRRSLITIHNNLASPIVSLTRLEEPDYVEMWLKCFGAYARKNLRDQRNVGGENEITNLFLASAGCEAIIKISVMAYPKDLEELIFQELKQIIRNNLSPTKKLVIAERTKFLCKKQNSNDLARSYLHRLKEASRFCEFEKLGTENMTI